MTRRCILFVCLAARLAAQAFDPPQRVTIGGSANDEITAVATDALGNVYVAGNTASFDFSVTRAFQATNNGAQIAVSNDAGVTWRGLANLPSKPVYTLAADPANSGALYAGASRTVYKSIDGGATWRALNLGAEANLNAQFTFVAIDPRQTNTVFACAFGGGIWKSTDGGESWTVTTTLAANRLAIDPFDTRVVFASSERAYRSNDGGQTWTPAPVPAPNIVFDPFSRGTLYSWSEAAIFKSVDGGQKWTAVSGWTPGIVIGLLADPVIPGTLYVSLGNIVRKSADGGGTWRAVDSLPSGLILAIHPKDPAILLGGLNDPRGVYVSRDRGTSWQLTNLSRGARSVVFDPSGSGRVWAATEPTQDAFAAKYAPTGELVFATYLGGQGQEFARSIAVDPRGNAYIAGYTSSRDFPVTAGAVKTDFTATGENAFVVKLDSGGALLYATYWGGSGTDKANGIAVDAAGNAVITGTTSSRDFPVTAGAEQAELNGLSDAFVSKLSSDGVMVLFSTYLGGEVTEEGRAVTLDIDGNAVVAGFTSSSGFPAWPPDAPAPVRGPQGAGFITKLGPRGTIISSRGIAGTGVATAVASDAAGNIYVTGETSSTDLPVTPEAYQMSLRANCPYPSGILGIKFVPYAFRMDDMYVVKLDSSLRNIRYASYLGGDCYDSPTGLALDGRGGVYIAGSTDSALFPTAAAVESGPVYSAYKGVVAALDPAASALRFSSYVSAGQTPAVAVDPAGNLYVGGADSGDGVLLKFAVAAAKPLVLDSVVNAFSIANGPVTPGEIVSLRVTGLDGVAPVNLHINAALPLPQELGGVRVLFDGIPASILSVERGKLRCVAPVALAIQPSARVEVEFMGRRSNPVAVEVDATSLGLLTQDGSGIGQANAYNEDGTVNSSDNPASRGSWVTLFFTGAGPNVSGIRVIGADAANLFPLFGSFPAGTCCALESTGVDGLPGFVQGIWQIGAKIPDRTPPRGELSVMLVSDSPQAFSQRVVIAVR